MSATRVTGNDLNHPWLVWLVGILFVVFGLGLLCYNLLNLSAAIEAASWEEVEATLDLVEVQRDHEFGLRVAALAYHYEYNGRRYDGRDGSLFSAFGSRFHDQAYVLQRKEERGEPVACYVDPGAPHHALIDRSVSAFQCAISTTFSSAFVAMGGSVLIALVAVSPRERRVEELSRRLPHEPWNWLPEWREREIPEDRPATQGLLLVVAGVCLLGFGSGFAACGLAETNDASPTPYLIGLIVAGVVAAVSCRGVVGKWCAERSLIEIETTPIRRGDSLRGTVRLAPKAFAENDTLVATLRCCEANATLTGYGAMKVYWEAGQTVEPNWRRGRADFSVEIAIPEDAPEFDRSGDTETLWWLEVRRQGQRHGRRVRFIVPVF